MPDVIKSCLGKVLFNVQITPMDFKGTEHIKFRYDF